MHIIRIAAALVSLALSTGSAGPQTLAELAKKEKERREKIAGEVRKITNDDTSKYRGGAVTTGGIPVQTQAGESAAKADSSPEGDEPVDFEGRPESFWRQTFSDARQRISQLENEANVLVLRLNDLQNRFYREDDGFRQQEIQREIQKTFYLQDLNKETIAKAREQLKELEKEARTSGALPGWIEGRKP